MGRRAGPLRPRRPRHRRRGRHPRARRLQRLQPKERKGADTAANYLDAKAPYLTYDHALPKGWPIATGIVEGAARHLVRDRMDITGARWGLDGAEAILLLRAVITNGDFDDYWAYHLEQEQHRNHHSKYADGRAPT